MALSCSENDDENENKNENESMKLELDLIQEMIKIGQAMGQRPLTIINVIYQLEFLHTERRNNDNNNDSILIKGIEREDVIGCYLLSSKYIERSPYKLKPKWIQPFCTDVAICDILKMEFNTIKQLDYNIDFTLTTDNYYFQMDKILYEMKDECLLKDMKYIELCEFCAETALNVMNRIGTFQIETNDNASLGCAIILYSLLVVNNMNRDWISNSVVNRLIKYGAYSNENNLLLDVNEIEKLCKS